MFFKSLPSLAVWRALALTCLSAGIACIGQTEPKGNTGFLKFSPSPDTVPADGNSTIRVVAQIDTSARFVNLQVAFTATAGAWLGASSSTPLSLTVPADDSGYAVATLRVPTDTQPVIITATTGNITKSRTITLKRVPPSGLVLMPPSSIPAAGVGVTVSLTATLLSTTGSPSSGDSVTFSANAVSGDTASGFFPRPTVPAIGGVATGIFVLTTGDSTTVVFHAVVPPSGKLASNAVRVHFNLPK
jgi:hypothetical protein